MNTKTAIKLLVGLTFTLSFLPYHVSVADVREDVSALMNHVRKSEPIDSTALRAAPPIKLLNELSLYLKDPNQSVRMTVIGESLGVIQRNPQNLPIRQRVAGLLVTIAESDPEYSVSGYAARATYTFPPYFVSQDFDQRAHSKILKLVNQQSPLSEFLLLAGVANLQEAKERLQEIGKNENDVAYLALARMGDQDAIQYVITKFQNSPDKTDQEQWTKLGQLNNLAYVRQPASVELIAKYLFSDLTLPSEDVRYYPRPHYSQYAINLMAQMLEDFPIENKGNPYTDAEVQIARTWYEEHKDTLKIKR